MIAWVLAVYGRLYVWLLSRDLAREHPDWDIAEVRRLARREIGAIRESIEEHFAYQDREVRILSDRLTRRFDMGMAMNEAANRAIEAKKAQFGSSYPTAMQEAALKLQAETLQERLRNTKA